MIVEQRTYVLNTGARLNEYLEAYESIGLPAQKPILGGFLGYFVTEFGRQNELNHFWAYEDLEDRRTRRAELAKNGKWQECLAIIRPMIMTMENRIMYPTSFSPIRTLPVAITDPYTAFSRNQEPGHDK
ncbi:NIPSNAP family protein [Arthrobacter sp. ok362]|uniref:NIPSNAP family protein n=1 Tax=Arthrobacter sp. ok362 TaxID=1761745 RepID=UPI000880239F|nr:NIPSNAP family protein [Arthrobacter sp. ok362]SDK58215.1 NIPSNAP protein [Arthrobacter sp. ok362]